MKRKSLLIAIVIILSFIVIIFGKYRHAIKYGYKDSKARYSWGEVGGSLYEASFNNKQYLLGIDAKTKEISKGKISINDLYFKGVETGHILTMKDSPKEENLSNNYAALYFPEIVLPYEDYAVSFKVTITTNNTTIIENIVLDFKKDYKEYYYSLWDAWMGI